MAVDAEITFGRLRGLRARGWNGAATAKEASARTTKDAKRDMVERAEGPRKGGEGKEGRDGEPTQ